MKTRLLFSLMAAALAINAPVSPALAQVTPVAMPGDTKLVNFVYDARNSYTILARPGSLTNIKLHDDEDVVALALGDSAQWVVSQAPGNIFIKPIFPNITTNASLVTTKRSYQLNLRAGPEDGKFYAQVWWDHPDLVVLQAKRQQQRHADEMARIRGEQSALAATVVTPGVDLEKLNFDYSISGDAGFRPQQVFDDGKFTWLRLPRTQEMPALFSVNKNGEHELLNFTLREQYIVVHRLVDKVLLKLGSEEVVVENTRNRKGFFSWGRG